MSRAYKFIKDTEETLDYEIDWTIWLNGDTISSSIWTVDAGITKDSDTFDNTHTYIWLSELTHGETYTLKNFIVTTAGRETYRVIIIAGHLREDAQTND